MKRPSTYGEARREEKSVGVGNLVDYSERRDGPEVNQAAEGEA
jgi:hypothetical protein